MRVLLINYEYPPVGGGAANATWEMARAMVMLGHEPVVLTARFRERTPDLDNPGIQVIEVPALRRRRDRCNVFEMATFGASAMLRVKRILQSQRIDAMVAYFSIPGGPIAWWGWRQTGIPYVVYLRGGDVPGNEAGLALFHAVLRPLRRTVFKHSRSVLANARSLKLASERADPYSVEIVPNGVDREYWSPITMAGLPARSGTNLIFVGRFHPQKNLVWLLQQLADQAASIFEAPWTLHLVGDGPQKHELADWVRRLRLQGNIVWHGWLNKFELRERYRQCDILVNPSHYEGMSNVVLEALSCGLAAVLSHEATGGEDIFRSGSVHLFDAGVPATFGAAMREAIKVPANRSSTSSLSWEQTARSVLKRLETRTAESDSSQVPI